MKAFHFILVHRSQCLIAADRDMPVQIVRSCDDDLFRLRHISALTVFTVFIQDTERRQV